MTTSPTPPSTQRGIDLDNHPPAPTLGGPVLEGVVLPFSECLEEQGWDFVPLKMGRFKGDNDANPWGCYIAGLSDQTPEYGATVKNLES